MKVTKKRIGLAFQTILSVSLLSSGVAGQAPMAMAQSQGTFTATGGMAIERVFHTATLLHDGRVLIVGAATEAARVWPSFMPPPRALSQ